MVALEVIIALTLLIFAGIIILKGKLTVEINVNVRTETAIPPVTAPAMPSAANLSELTEEEKELYQNSHSILGTLNHILSTGELPKDLQDPKELK